MTCICFPSSVFDTIRGLAEIVIFVTILFVIYWKRKPIWDWLNKEKSPVWFILVMISYAFPVGILIIIFPVFGAMIWENLGINTPPYWIIGEGLKWSMLLDVTLIVWAYLSFKIDYFFPALGKRFKKEP